MLCAIFRSWSRGKAAPMSAESDTEVEYGRRLNVRRISPSMSLEVTQGRSRTLQRLPYTTNTTTPAAAGAIYSDDVTGGGINSNDVIGDPRHHRQTSLPNSTTSGLFNYISSVFEYTHRLNDK